MALVTPRQRIFDRAQTLARPQRRHTAAKGLAAAAHQRLQQVDGPAAGEDVVARGPAVLITLQGDQMIQQGRIAQAPLDADGTQFGLHAAPGAFLVLEVFSEAGPTLGIPGVKAPVRQDRHHRIPRQTRARRSHPGVDAEPGPTQQTGDGFQIRHVVGPGDHPVIVVHRGRQRLDRPAPALVREEADDIAAAMQHRHRRPGTDSGGDAGERRLEIGTGQLRVGGDHRPPQVQVSHRQGVGRDDLELQSGHYSSWRGAADVPFPSHPSRPLLQDGLAAW